MGQRANLIVVEDGEFLLRYDHWVANRLDDVLFWGADYALRYFEAQETIDAEGWLDDVWAEGGAVLNLDEKHLLWFGGEDIMYELPLRRAYLNLQKQVWQDWTIEWAHRGIVDLAEYVNVPKEKVLSECEKSPLEMKLRMPERKSWIRALGSVRNSEGQIRLFPLADFPEYYLRDGEDLLRQCEKIGGLEKIVWIDWEENGDFPQGGFFIDEKYKTVEFWQTTNCPNTVAELKSIWENWDVIWRQDDYEFQMQKLADRVVLPEIDETRLIESLRASLLREDGKNWGVQAFLDSKDALEKEGKVVKINEWALKSQAVENPLETKTQIWQRIFGE